MWYRKALCALGLCLFSMSSQAETYRYTFSLPEVTYAGMTYAADSISFEGQSLLPIGPWDDPPLARGGENLNGFLLHELTLDGGSGSWSLGATNYIGNKSAGDVVGFFFHLSDADAPGIGTYTSGHVARQFADGNTFVDTVVSSGTLTISAVPVPAALWLFASGLGLAGAFRRAKPAAPGDSVASRVE